MAKRTVKTIEAELRDYALSFPETVEEHPWDHIAVKVRGKTFVFLGGHKNPDAFSMSVKLPESRDLAADLPFASPTGYGLGKSGWVTAEIEKPSEVPIDLMRGWIKESYRAIAPKKLSKLLDA